MLSECESRPGGAPVFKYGGDDCAYEDVERVKRSGCEGMTNGELGRWGYRGAEMLARMGNVFRLEIIALDV